MGTTTHGSFDQVQASPADPIFFLNDLFAADQRPDKVNLGVGVYLDEQGRLPLLGCIRRAQERLAATPAPFGYLPMGGLPELVSGLQRLVFGDAVDHSRIASVQTLGGSGALKVCQDFCHQQLGLDRAVVSDPTWANHLAILTGAGFRVGPYRWFDPSSGGLDAPGLLADLGRQDVGTLVVLHGCCHNPTGVDPDEQTWAAIADVCAERGLVPLVDLAYQGFGDGIEADRVAVDAFLASGQRFFVANSCSKNFSLYGERVGGLHLVCTDAAEAGRITSQLCRTVRASYSTPPSTGARLVATVLADEELHAQWADELGTMRERIHSMRTALVDALHQRGVADFDVVAQQRGMFSLVPLSREQMQALRTEHGVYGTDEGRLCLAGLREQDVAHVAGALAAVR